MGLCPQDANASQALFQFGCCQLSVKVVVKI